jgi:hypothetical protein
MLTTRTPVSHSISLSAWSTHHHVPTVQQGLFLWLVLIITQALQIQGMQSGMQPVVQGKTTVFWDGDENGYGFANATSPCSMAGGQLQSVG